MTGPRPIGVTKGAIISAVSHEGLSVTVDGKPAQLAIITEDGHIFAAGEKVAREVEADRARAGRRQDGRRNVK